MWVCQLFALLNPSLFGSLVNLATLKAKVSINNMVEVSLRNLVMVILTCYFVFIIYESNTKWSKENIGTMFRTVNVKTVQYPPITVCTYRNRHWNDSTGSWETFEIDHIPFMNEFPERARSDLLLSVEHSMIING